ncbi:MAG: sulfotransferase family 2 domain-containing protein [Eubacteriales bacterium]
METRIKNYPKVLFFHIPKTAGTSIFEALRHVYGEKNVKQIENELAIDEKSADYYKDFDVLGGHFLCFSHAEIFLKDRYSFIMLRDPVDRFLSQYYYYKYSVPDAEVNESVKAAKKYDIDEFVSYRENSNEKFSDFQNRQVFMLRNHAETQTDADQLLAMAKANIRKFDFIGLYEYLDESLQIVSKELNLIEELLLSSINISKKDNDISVELKQRIRELNCVEEELYNYAKGIFYKRLQSADYVNKGKGMQNLGVKKIILHVGMTKTATTSIQSTLSDKANKNILEEDNLYFPIGCSHTEFLINNFNKSPSNSIENMNSGETAEAIRRKALVQKKAFEEEIVECRLENIILSAECIIAFDEDSMNQLKLYLMKLMPNARIEVIISTREFMSWTASSIQQHIRNVGIDMYEYINNRYTAFNHSVRISRLVDVFGKDNISIYKFEQARLHQFGPVGYFLEHIGVNIVRIEKYKISKSNEGIKDKGIDIVRYINANTYKYIAGQLSPNRQKDDTVLFERIRGDEFKLNKREIKKFKEIVKKESKYVRDEFRIDYISENKEYEYRKKLIFDKDYYEDIISIFPELTDTIKKLTYDYLLKTKRKTSKRCGRQTIKSLIQWIKAEQVYILDVEVNTRNLQKEQAQKTTKRIRKFLGRAYRRILRAGNKIFK